MSAPQLSASDKAQKKKVQKDNLRRYVFEYGIQDCKNLLKAFAQLKTVRFEEFATLWREKGYSLLQGAIDLDRRAQFVDTLFGVFLHELHSDNVLNCVAGIYGVYCLFITQACKPRAKVRFTPELWARLEQVQQWAREDGRHCDVDFIIRKLKWEKAFYIVAYPSLLLLGSGKTWMDGEGDVLRSFLDRQPMTYIPEAVNDSHLKELKELTESYQQSKQLVDPDGAYALSLVTNNFAEDIARQLEEHEQWKLEKRAQNLAEVQNADKAQGSSRNTAGELKERAYRGMNKIGKRGRSQSGYGSDDEWTTDYPPIRRDKYKLQ